MMSIKSEHTSFNSNAGTATGNNPRLSLWNLEAINETLEHASPQTILLWALSQGLPTITTTSFGEHSAATLHLVQSLGKRTPTVWVDTGFSNPATHRHAQALTRRLSLDLRRYTPLQSPMALLKHYGARSEADLDPEHRARVASVTKLEPFERALSELRPKVWITGIRRSETAYRQTLKTVTQDARGILKVAPFFQVTDEGMYDYLERHQLPINRDYCDPTKAAPHLECGLHKRTVFKG